MTEQSIRVWDDFRVKSYKFEIAWFAVGEALFTSAIWVLAFLRLIPMARLPWLYCAAYYVFFTPIYIVNLFMSQSESKLLFLIAAYLNSFIWALNILVFSMLVYGLIACSSGTIPLECRDTQIWDILVLILTGFLLYITTRVFIICWNLVTIIRQARSRRSRISPPTKMSSRLDTAYRSPSIPGSFNYYYGGGSGGPRPHHTRK